MLLRSIQVYPATHRSTGTPVVIKMVPKTKLCQLPADHHSAVEVEIAVLRRINHPFIVNFYAAYEDGKAGQRMYVATVFCCYYHSQNHITTLFWNNSLGGMLTSGYANTVSVRYSVF